MFGAIRFGTIRFGESPLAVSPVLLSGIGVQDTGAGVQDLGVERRVRVIGPQDIGVQGVHVGVERKVRGSRCAITSSQTTVPTGRRMVGVVVQNAGVQGLKVRVERRLVSGQRTSTLSEIHVLPTITLAGGSVAGTASSTTIAFPGIVVRASQGCSSDIAMEIERRLASDMPSQGSVGLTTVHETTNLVSSTGGWAWAEASIQPGGLLILNVQSTVASGRMRAERRLRGAATEPSRTADLQVRVARGLAGSENGVDGCRVLIIGAGLVIRVVQDDRTRGLLQVAGSIHARGVDHELGCSTINVARIVGGEGVEEGIVLLTPLTTRALSTQCVQADTMQALVGRVRSISGFDQEAMLFFGRFAVLPDLSNDRLVVIFAEGRRTVIPRQSEM